MSAVLSCTVKEVKLLIISHQRSSGKGERKVKSKASMVALVAWPEGKLNLSTILTVATLTRGGDIILEVVSQ